MRVALCPRLDGESARLPDGAVGGGHQAGTAGFLLLARRVKRRKVFALRSALTTFPVNIRMAEAAMKIWKPEPRANKEASQNF